MTMPTLIESGDKIEKGMEAFARNFANTGSSFVKQSAGVYISCIKKQSNPLLFISCLFLSILS